MRAQYAKGLPGESARHAEAGETGNSLENPRDADERIRIMLDVAPIALTMWDRKFNIIDCSWHAVEILGFSGKQELLERLVRCMPPCQPNGRRSRRMLKDEMTKAFETGRQRVEWMHLTAGGESILFDLSLVRVRYKDDDALILYARDIWKEKRILAELARRDAMLAAQAHWYKSILDAIPLPLSVTDADMRLTFVNTPAVTLFGRAREELTGRPCSCWNVPICGTEECSITRAKRGFKQTFFKHNGVSHKVDVEIIRDAADNISGFLEILHDVTEIEKTARQQADEANEAKSMFLTTMSHEMRTPLNAVIGLSELTLDDGGLSEEAESNLCKISNAGSTLLSIVNDILDLSKIRSGKFEIFPTEYDVPGMINDAVTQSLLRIGSKPVRFVLDIDANVPMRLYGDDLRIKQIIFNLLSNAFKYTEQGMVEFGLRCAQEGETVRMTIGVSDTGIGIRPEYLEHLFSDYTRFDAQANRKVGGTGLGLSITKNLAEMMGGTVSVTSTYGQGSVFTVTIRQQPVNSAVIGAELAESLRNFSYITNKRNRNARLKRIHLPYARVLVVDDNITNLDVAKGLMKPYGMRIDCVTDGQAAIDAVREEKVRYNAIFMDHMMPGMDGMEATRRIREIGTEYAESIPIIALTANAVVGKEELFLHNGFQAFISKPIDMARLDEAIRRFVRDKDQEAALALSEPEEQRHDPEDRQQDRRTGRDRRAGGRRKHDAPHPHAEATDGLDWNRGLALFGDETSFLQVLRSYALNTRPLLASISELCETSLTQYAIIVHGIKGSSYGICADTVGSLAEALELAAKAGDADFVSLHNPAFLEAARKLIAHIEALLGRAVQADPKPQKSRPDETTLLRLCAACKRYDLDEIDALVQELERYDYTADDGLAAWLCDAAARFQYTQLVEKITQLTQGTADEFH